MDRICDEFVRRSSADTTGDVSRMLSKLEAIGADLTINRIVANSSAVFRPFILMSDAILCRCAISAGARESLILALAVDAEVPYEWAEHVPMALRAGLSHEQIAHIAAKNFDASIFPYEYLLAIRIARKIYAGTDITSTDWSEAVRHWDIDGALELILTVGWYGAFIPTLLRAIGLEEPDSVAT